MSCSRYRLAGQDLYRQLPPYLYGWSNDQRRFSEELTVIVSGDTRQICQLLVKKFARAIELPQQTVQRGELRHIASFDIGNTPIQGLPRLADAFNLALQALGAGGQKPIE